jgi:hypothetical protein
MRSVRGAPDRREWKGTDAVDRISGLASLILSPAEMMEPVIKPDDSPRDGRRKPVVVAN